jgi:hypothetical protein
MHLSLYLFKNGIKKKDFGDKLGVSRRTMTNITVGGVCCSRNLARRIQELTNGEVGAWEMMGLDCPPADEQCLKSAQKTAIDLLEEMGLLKSFDNEKISDKLQRHYIKKKFDSKVDQSPINL